MRTMIEKKKGEQWQREYDNGTKSVGNGRGNVDNGKENARTMVMKMVILAWKVGSSSLTR